MGLWTVHFGPGSYLLSGPDNIAELKEEFSSGKMQNDFKKAYFLHDLTKSRLCFTSEYAGLDVSHDMAKVETEKPELILGDDHKPTGRSETVYLCVDPPIDWEAYRASQQEYIKEENRAYERKKAEEEKEAAGASA
mmetsp:Transcript_44499/g.88923  ORF Transcript_44499/g.88923 Transcript_44499/m.88923 type:complete len:136 (-) Transcript_44499:231-638(-)